MALINEITKAWHYPEYWAYVSICREMDMDPKPPAPEAIYDRTHIPEYIRRADYEYGLRNFEFFLLLHFILKNRGEK